VGSIANDDPGRPEMTMEEISQELGIPYNTVNCLMKRAMKKLRDGRAVRIKDLAIAREKEVRYGLPRIIE
jgi:DNA-binding CsgD family transcriptional regulator